MQICASVVADPFFLVCACAKAMEPERVEQGQVQGCAHRPLPDAGAPASRAARLRARTSALPPGASGPPHSPRHSPMGWPRARASCAHSRQQGQSVF